MTQVIGVIGLGTMGAGIVEVCLAAGHDVIAFDGFPVARETGLARVAKGFARRVEKGTMAQADADAALARLTGAETLAGLKDADLVIEAVAELPDVKHALFRELGELMQPDAILATNTSAISVTGIAEASGRPDRVVGLHFFNPAPVMKLVEVVRTQLVDPQVYADAIEFAEGLDRDVQGHLGVLELCGRRIDPRHREVAGTRLHCTEEDGKERDAFLFGDSFLPREKGLESGGIGRVAVGEEHGRGERAPAESHHEIVEGGA